MTDGNVRACPDGADVAGYARSRTGGIATNAVDTEAAQALGRRRAGLAVFLFADPVAVARLVYPGTRGHTIGVVQTGGDVGADADSTGDVARFARPAAHGVAANAVEALTADAFAARRARLPIVGFAGPGGITSLGAVAGVGGHVVFARGERRANTHAAHDIARIARGGACSRATNAVDTEVADAFRREAAPLRVVLLANARAVTRVCPRATGKVFAPFRHIDALAEFAGHVARLA